jgi:hypothetical protein
MDFGIPIGGNGLIPPNPIGQVAREWSMGVFLLPRSRCVAIRGRRSSNLRLGMGASFELLRPGVVVIT